MLTLASISASPAILIEREDITRVFDASHTEVVAVLGSENLIRQIVCLAP
jgi:hypothetical protein